MDKTLRQIDQELVESMRERNLKNAGQVNDGGPAYITLTMQQIADNLSALNSDAPEVADAVIKLTNMAKAEPVGYFDADQLDDLKRMGGSITFGTYSERYSRTTPLYTHPSQGVVDERRLIGWRTGDYLWETADRAVALNWLGNVEVLPIFEGDPNTKLKAAALPAVPEVDPMAAFFAKRKEDEAQVFIARAKHALREILVALEDENYEESRSLILDALGESATPAHDQPEGGDNE